MKKFHSRRSSCTSVEEHSKIISKEKFLEVIAYRILEPSVDSFHLFIDHMLNLRIRMRTMWCGVANDTISFTNLIHSFVSKFDPSQNTMIFLDHATCKQRVVWINPNSYSHEKNVPWNYMVPINQRDIAYRLSYAMSVHRLLIFQQKTP